MKVAAVLIQQGSMSVLNSQCLLPDLNTFVFFDFFNYNTNLKKILMLSDGIYIIHCHLSAYRNMDFHCHHLTSKYYYIIVIYSGNNTFLYNILTRLAKA